jgi:hypothetical protein
MVVGMIALAACGDPSWSESGRPKPHDRPVDRPVVRPDAPRVPCGTASCAPTQYCIEMHASGGAAPGVDESVVRNYSCMATPRRSAANVTCEPPEDHRVTCVAQVK